MSITHQEILLDSLLNENKTDLRKVILDSKLHWDVKNTLSSCLNYCLDLKRVDENMLKMFEIESVIDYLHDELNTGHWSEVAIYIRQNFTCASFLKCIILMKSSAVVSAVILKKCLRCLDMGLLLGAPIENLELLSKSASYLSEVLNKLQETTDESMKIIVTCTKRSIDEDHFNTFKLIKAKEVSTTECPTLEYFNKHYFKLQIPVKLTGCMGHWPASRKWLDVNYLLNIAANRTVPIEIGSHYVDTNWSQKLMTFKDFIRNHYLSDTGDIGYLAQYNLFDHITELREDICTPEYCCLSFDYKNLMDPDINAWLGPKGTVSPLHYDPKNNILAQVYGTKQIILFDPDDTKYLYPHETKMLSNTSQVDPLKQDLEAFPDIAKAQMYKCLIEPGEMLFIPNKWWHHVTALEKSFSVSFWWE